MSTERSRPIEGYRQPEESDKDKPVDPKRFEEELKKVQESDPTEKRKKRNLKKTEEEGEEEEGAMTEKPLPSPGNVFGSYMTEGTEKDSALSIKDPSNAKAISTPQSSGKIISFEDEDTSKKAPLESNAPAESSSKAEEESSYQQALPPMPETSQPQAKTENQPSVTDETKAPQNQAPPPSTPTTSDQNTPSDTSGDTDNLETDQTTPSTKEQKLDQDQDTSQANSPRKAKKKKEAKKDTSLIKEQKPSFDEYLRKKKEKGVKDLKFSENTQAPSSSKPEDNEKKIKKEESEITPQPQKKKDLPSSKTTAKHLDHLEKQKIKEQDSLKKNKTHQTEQKPQQAPNFNGEGKTQKPLTEQDKFKASETAKAARPASLDQPLTKSHEAGKDQDGKDKEKDKEKKSEELSDSSQVTPLENPAPVQPTVETPAYSQLHPQVYDLFEKMVGVMIIEQHKGVTTTTMTINMKNSVFDGSQIVLEHYSTAPNAFNIQLVGSPQAQQLFNDNINDLASAFASSKYSFEVNIKKPILLKEYKTFSRKENISRDEGEGKKGR